MALNISNKYPGRANAPSIDYPEGSIKNQTAPGAKDGTPLDADWANDKEGFFQSLLKESGITANGNVDTVVASQLYDALLQVISDTAPLPPQATDLVAGIAKVATSAILMAGTNEDSFATAKGLKDAGLWPIGVGQTLQIVTGSRATNTTYTNSTGRTIYVMASLDITQGADTILQLGGNSVGRNANNGSGTNAVSFSFHVLAGQTYRIAGGTILYWSEVR